MSDPYNSADGATPLERSITKAGPVERHPARKPMRPTPAATESIFWKLFPVWNVIALIAGLLWTAKNGPVHFRGAMWLYGPLVLAIVAGAWSSSRVFVLVVRALNALLALFIIYMLLKFASVGLFSMKFATIFLMTALMPILNALFLQSRVPE
ncbi:MAG TPA: hypothetical protein VM687_12475 [Stenotrophomonas sp.]|nr:hypothetical protein [Stenotrophomonas sp.]